MTKEEALKLALWHEAMAREPNRNQAKREKHEATAKFIKEALAHPERDYERGFVDGMQKQMQSSVDKAVNAMSQRTWVGLTNGEMIELSEMKLGSWDLILEVEDKLKDKNT